MVDLMAEDFEDVSPYNYGMNNPILMIDPDGMASDTAGVIRPEPKPVQLQEVSIVLAIDRGVATSGQRLDPWGLLPVAGYYAGK